MDSTKKLRRAYSQHKKGAHARGIPWEFTFETWLRTWEQSGKLEQRGIGKDKYCMSRPGDSGPYSPCNVRVVTNSENIREVASTRGKKSSCVPGVFLVNPGSPKAWCYSYRGRKRFFHSEAEAIAYRGQCVAERKPRKIGSGIGYCKVNRPLRKKYVVSSYGKTEYFETPEEARSAYLRRCAEYIATQTPEQLFKR